MLDAMLWMCLAIRKISRITAYNYLIKVGFENENNNNNMMVYMIQAIKTCS